MRKTACSPLSLIPSTSVPASDMPSKIVKPEAPSAAIAPVVPEGFEEMFEDDLIVPRYSITQPTSQIGTPGTFKSNLSGEERRELRLVPLKIARGRVLWSDTLGEEPTCKSTDGLVPAATVEKPVNGACCTLAGRRLKPTCPMAMWHRNGNGDGVGRNEPPKCRDNYVMIAFDTEAGAPVMLSFHGTGIRAVRLLRTLIFQRRVALYDTTCTLRLRKEQNGKGAYFVPEFVDVQQVDPPGKHRNLYEQFTRYEVEDPLEPSHDGGDADAGGSPPA